MLAYQVMVIFFGMLLLLGVSLAQDDMTSVTTMESTTSESFASDLDLSANGNGWFSRQNVDFHNIGPP